MIQDRSLIQIVLFEILQQLEASPSSHLTVSVGTKFNKFELPLLAALSSTRGLIKSERRRHSGVILSAAASEVQSCMKYLAQQELKYLPGAPTPGYSQPGGAPPRLSPKHKPTQTHFKASIRPKLGRTDISDDHILFIEHILILEPV